MTFPTERDEISTARQHPAAHPLRTIATCPRNLTELRVADGVSPQEHEAFRAAARVFVNDLRGGGVLPSVILHFENQTYRDNGTVHEAHGDISGWSRGGEISFTDGTRLNDKLLLRVIL